jgi:hypothetical protein
MVILRRGLLRRLVTNEYGLGSSQHLKQKASMSAMEVELLQTLETQPHFLLSSHDMKE